MFGNKKKKNQKKANGKKAEQKKAGKLAAKNQAQKKPAKPAAPKASAAKKPLDSKQAPAPKKTVAPKQASVRKQPKKYVRYIAVVETRRNGSVEQWSPKPDGHSLTASGRWTDAKLHSNKKAAEEEAKQIASGFNDKENPIPFVRRCEITIGDEMFDNTVKQNTVKKK